MPKVRINGVDTWCYQAGAGPDLVMIHGLAANLAFWYLKILPALASDYRVTVYDLRGHGRSEMPSSGYSSRDMAADLMGLMDQLGIDRAHLAGHSYGGLIALQVAVAAPDRVISVTLADAKVRALQPPQKLKDWPHWGTWKPQLEGVGVFLDEEEELDYRLLEALARRGSQVSLGMLSPSVPFIPFDTWSGGKKLSLRWLKLLETTTAARDFKTEEGIPIADLRRIEHPVLAVYGELSHCLPSCEGLQRTLQRCRSFIVPGAGHFHPVVKPDLFSATLRDFLAETGAVAGALR